MVLAVSGSFAGIAYGVQRAIVLPEFAQVEQREAARDLARGTHAPERDAEFLASTARDYAARDDTCAYAARPDPTYESANLIPETFDNLGPDLFAIVRSDGTLLWGKRRESDSDELVDAPEVLSEIARAGHPLVAHARPDSKKGGMLATPLGLMLVGSSAITSSDQRAPATSSGASQRREISSRAAASRTAAGSEDSTPSVSVWPGETTFTRTLRRAPSSASTRDKPALTAQYQRCDDRGGKPCASGC